MIDRVPPQNIEAEQAVLGSMLLDKEAIFNVIEILKSSDFYLEAHRVIYEAIVELNEQGQAVDLVTLTEELRRKSLLDKVGGVSSLAFLSSVVPTAANAEHYARIVEEKATLRSLITAATKIAQKAYEGEEDLSQLLDDAERMIMDISQRRRKEGFTPIKELLINTIEHLEYLVKHKGEATGVPTFRDLDKLLSGLHKSDLIICAARPGMGKTSFCLNIAQKVAIKEKLPVAIFSLEMSKEQLVQRMLSSEAMVDQHKLRSGFLQEEDWKRLASAAGRLAEAPIFIDDTPAISVLEIRGKTRKLKAETGLGLVIIDYLQLMQSSKRTENRQQEISDISRSLKALARELDIPVLALSQLSRAVEQTHDKRPALSHLRESGSLEQDSDCVLFIHRPEYYDPETDKKGIAEIIVAKHRHGPTGSVEVGFLAEFTKFVDLAQQVG
ncbi:replicative DNA helicase [Zhaonella formicivorans]|uniref:replicative DNA helicase n=1 Tax=Zhaonella formicivorans TaxID=2528593 RepID=UPI003BF5FEBA